MGSKKNDKKKNKEELFINFASRSKRSRPKPCTMIVGSLGISSGVAQGVARGRVAQGGSLGGLAVWGRLGGRGLLWWQAARG